MQPGLVNLKQQHVRALCRGEAHRMLQRFVVPRAQVPLEPNHMHASFRHQTSFQPVNTSCNTSTGRSGLA